MSVTYTPMIEQYINIKKEHPNEILFFRLGDFYEMFFDDAVLASKELEITLTGRDAGMPDRIPMCGVPYHAVEGYITKLIKKGFRIAICEQVEDPKIAKGIVKREVVKIITPGTVMSDQILEDKSNQYLALLYEENDSLVIAAADISTGDCLWNMCKGTDRYEKIKDFIYQINPAELVTVGVISDWNKIEEFCEHKIPKCVFTVYRLNEEDDIDTIFEKNFSGVKVPKEIETTVSYLLSYLYSTLKSDLSHINKLTELSYDDTMVLDSTALRNLEILKNMRDNTKKDTLLSVLDFTFTAMGGRQLRRWLEMPLLNIDKIRSRQNVIKAFLNHPSEREDIISFLKKINDIERILSRIEVGTANARDLYALCISLSVLPEIKNILNIFEEQDLRKISERFELNTALYNLLSSALVDDPPFSIREGGMIRDGFDIELDELKAISRESKKWMTDFEQNLKTTSGIKNLKVGYNKVFGYYIEVTKSNIDNVPDFFVRKQTLANAERYIVPELKEFENKILGAQERIANLEYHLFNNLREEVRKYIVSLQKTANILADIDAYMSLTIAADKYNYVCPNLNNNQEIIIKDGRHPVVERILVREMFVPNDTFLNMYDQRTIVITGPNMAGKSTYMRQVALLVLMTQVGSFIPVREASIAPVDRIFTRVGASDDLASGQSTFMLEMTEVAQIIRYATEKSLIILDEVGRGTSTYDGMSIAQSVIEYISSNIKAKTLFATHYHELIELEKCIDCLKNYSVAVKEKGNNVVFLRRIIPGGADKSYGIHVAELAGLPKKLLKRSQELLNEYSHTVECSASSCFSEKTLDKNDIQNTLFQSIITQELANIDIFTMTPLEALNKLSELQKQAKQEIGLP